MEPDLTDPVDATHIDGHLFTRAVRMDSLDAHDAVARWTIPPCPPREEWP